MNYNYNVMIRNKLIVQTLKKALQGERVSHAYLFSGPEGAGKSAAALDFAQSLLCEAPAEGESCGSCRSCRLVRHGNHPDLHWVGPSGSSIKIQQMRDIIRKMLFRPYQGGHVVIVIEQADKMTIEAANCLLKTLEEPPPKAHFILLAAMVQRLPATIVSRCQCFSFRSPAPREAAAGLNGDREEARRLAGVLEQAGCLEALTEVEAVAQNREKALRTLDILTGWYRDLLVWRETNESRLLFCPEQLPVIMEDAGDYDSGILVNIIEEIEKTRNNIAGNTNIRLLMEGLFLKVNAFQNRHRIRR